MNLLLKKICASLRLHTLSLYTISNPFQEIKCLRIYKFILFARFCRLCFFFLIDTSDLQRWHCLLSWFQAHYYPQTITETILFDVAPEVRGTKQKNVLERLWAYLTIQDLLRRVARFEISSFQKLIEINARTGIINLH